MRGEKLSRASRKFLAPLSGTPHFKIGELHTIFYLCFLVLFVYLSVFALVSFIKNQKVVILLAATMGSSEDTKLCDFTSHNNSDFICTPIATPATSAPSYEIKPALLNLAMKDAWYRINDSQKRATKKQS